MTARSATKARTGRPRSQARVRRARAPAAGVNRDDAVATARRELAAAFRWAARLGFHEGTCNHFSLKVPGREDRYLINPHGRHFSELRASDLSMLDADGNTIEGRYPVEPTAFFIHSRIHRANADAKCVLHTHMPYATALTMLDGARLEPCLQTCLRFYGRIAYDDDFGGYGGLVLDTEEGDRLCRALGDKRVLMLANHGVIVTAPSVAEAFNDLYYLERAAEAQVLAMSTGRKLKLVGDNLAAKTRDQFVKDSALYAGLHFGALCRILDREAPDYAR
jgi:ribulose-5-phosphate 4-epimerase/fuculose-1-phosphate aldolase